MCLVEEFSVSASHVVARSLGALVELVCFFFFFFVAWGQARALGYSMDLGGL